MSTPFSFVELIVRKRDGKKLRDADWRVVARSAAALKRDPDNAPVPAYQLSALLMAAYLRGMAFSETRALTTAVADSGERLDWSGVDRPTVDKHSTGGVGDKLSLIAVPLLAACGAAVPKLSGRALGHTGGTIDKLESIPGLRLEYTAAELGVLLRENGCFIAGHSDALAPADAVLYHLRDVTATVASRPLVAASIVGKKLAAGAGTFVIDVKSGRGAIFRSQRESLRLARDIVRLARDAGRRCVCLLTGMDQPLGRAVGNALEVEEALAVLEGEGPGAVRDLALELTARGLKTCGLAGTIDEARETARRRLDDGAAHEIFERMITAQGGDLCAFVKRSHHGIAEEALTAPRSGWLRRIGARAVARTAMLLGAGREKAADAIDHEAGVLLAVERGDRLETGQPLARLHTRRPETLAAARKALAGAFVISADRPTPHRLLREVVE